MDPADAAARARAAHRRRLPASQVFWLVLTGCLLLQLAYATVVPAFRGADEFDHVYKADSVAHGQLFGTVDTPGGRGELLEVSPDLQRAAQAWCRDYTYTMTDDCRVVAHAPGGLVTVSSAAASYNPAYYAVVGTTARPFVGDGALWSMRLWTIAGCSLLLAGAAAVTSRWARTAWPGAALTLACTPTLLYSGAVVAPNGVGYAAAVLWWASAVALVRRTDRHTWATFGLATVVTLVCHSTNPMWVPLMLVAVAVLRPLSSWVRVLRTERWSRIAAAVVVIGTLACLAWARLVGTHAVPLTTGPDGDYPFPWGDFLGNMVAWHLQAVAAFPLRNEPVNDLVYPLWLAPLVGLLVLGALVADRRHRAAMALLLAAWFVVPLVLTLRTYLEMDFSWQGRYALPLVIGLPFLAASALDGTRDRAPRPLLPLLAMVAVLGHTACVVEVAWEERDRGLSTQLVGLLPGGWVLAGVAAAVGAVLLVWGSTRTGPRPSLPVDRRDQPLAVG